MSCWSSGECSGASSDRGISRLLVFISPLFLSCLSHCHHPHSSTVRALVQVAHDVSSRTEAVCSLLCERVLASPHDVSTREASDVCLQCSDGVTFHAHSFVLCAFSEFFRSMMGWCLLGVVFVVSCFFFLQPLIRFVLCRDMEGSARAGGAPGGVGQPCDEGGAALPLPGQSGDA